MIEISTLYLMFFSITIFAQKNFVEGSISTQDGSSIKGLIDYQEWLFNPRQIAFKTALDSETQILYPASIKAFRIDYKNEEYISAAVAVNYIDKSINQQINYELNNTKDMIFKMPLQNDVVFLQTIVSGVLNLYYLSDANRGNHYFIQKDDGKIEELQYLTALVPAKIKVKERKYRKVTYIAGRNGTGAFDPLNNLGNNSVDASYYIILEAYKMQLIAAMSETKALHKKVDIMEYPYDLENIVSQYNEKMGEKDYVKPYDRGQHSFYAQTGIVQPTFIFKDAFVTSNKAIKGKISPVIGIGLNFGIPRTLNKLSVGLEASYLHNVATHEEVFTDNSNSTPVRTINYKMVLNGFRLNGLVKYFVYNGKVAPYVLAGLGRSHYGKSEFDASERQLWYNEKPIDKKELILIGGVGLTMKNLFLETRYEMGSDINRNSINWYNGTGEDLRLNRLTLTVGYAWRF